MTETKAPAPNDPLTYSRYLRVKELIALQQPLSDPPAHDEMLFIVIHQVYELWFRQILHELEAFITTINQDRILVATRMLERVSEIFRVLIQQVDVLETMTPVEFNRFRSKLNPASGFQSFQFRELELIAGADPAEYQRFFALEPEWRTRLEQRSARPTLRSAFVSLLVRKGLVGAEASPEAIEAAVLTIYEKELVALESLCEALIRFDEQIALWRYRHMQMVERMIGRKKGTGGSLGVAYLETTLRKRYFPELWAARTHMGAGSGY
jgi:tryptophan 2,3-dioxygenase